MLGEIDFFGILNQLGLTPSTAVPLGIAGVIAYLVFSKKINKYLNPIKLAITEIQTILSVSGQPIKHSLTETAKSPLQPTDFGLELLKKSGMEEFVNNKIDFLFKELKKKLNKGYTAYDVQEQSIKVMIELKDTNLLNTIKEYAFKNGMSIETILRLGGLMLRDKFLKETQLK